MRQISRWMASYYYPSWKQSHSAHTHYTLHGILDVFSLSVLVEEPVHHTSTSTIVPPVASSPPALHQTCPPPWGDHLMFCGLLKAWLILCNVKAVDSFVTTDVSTVSIRTDWTISGRSRSNASDVREGSRGRLFWTFSYSCSVHPGKYLANTSN